MIRNFHLLILTGVLAVSCQSNQKLSLQVINPLDQQRNDAVILLTHEEISGWTEIPEGKVPLLSYENGDPVSCQLDDLDDDGQWDELFALTDMKSNGELIIQLTFIEPEKYPSFVARTNVRMGANRPGYPELMKAERLEGISFHNYAGVTGKEFQMEGPAWETDQVGFRNYLDQRNGMDIFGKITSEMVLDSVGIAGRPSYHQLDSWGMDILKVGTSLGSGAIGYMFNDSIYRVGDNGSGSYSLQFEGSQRSRFNLSFSNWKVEGTPLDINHEIEIVGGRHCFQSFVTYSGSDIALDLVTGIVNMKSDTVYLMELNDLFSGLLTHDFQAEDSSMLAMAVVVPTYYLTGHAKSKDKGEGITQTYYVTLKAEPDQPTPYRFYALWEKEDPRWSSIVEVSNFLKKEADRWAYSVIVQPAP